MRAFVYPSKRCVSFFVSAFLTLVIFCVCSVGQSQEAPSTSTVRQPLITRAIDETALTTLRGNTHPLARPVFDLGTAPASLPMERMLLVLRRSPEQEFALRKLLDDQQDKKSPNYHKWMTPEQYGAQFGPTDSDMQTITSWLQSHGFQVGTTKGRTVLEFSGSASQVAEAFHTTIHKYMVNGEQHWANASDPSIPTALVPAVSGIATLHNFLKKPLIHISEHPVAVSMTGGKNPHINFSGGTHGLAPGDYSTIYNYSSLYDYSVNAGVGAAIGIVGRSNLYVGPNTGAGQDVLNFRDLFIPCCAVGNFQIVVNGPDPGDLGGSEEAEATLDSAWAGGVASGAGVSLVVSGSTNTTDGVDLSELYIVENNLTDIMTESFGSCEAMNTDSEVAFISLVAEQAAAQGITYMVSTGDNGAEGCDNPASASATGPVSVNLLAATPFNVAVGGTVFNENGQNSLYWSTTNSSVNYGSALSYIPEDVWNDSCAASKCTSSANLWAGSGGASSGNLSSGGTFTGFAKPSWQSGVTGIPSDGVRDLPDVSLSAASHDPYVLCLDGSCITNSQGQFYVYFVWGTSAAAPSFAGMMAYINTEMAQLNPGQGRGIRQGQADYILYRLAATENFAQCNGSSTTPPTSTCIFHDITVGNNSVPGEVGYPNGLYATGTGYDLATGLGSVNLANLVSNWSTVTFNPTTTALTLNGGTTPITLTHGQSVAVDATVAPNSGSGNPTGDVVLYTSIVPSTLSLFHVTNGQAVGSVQSLPGGTYYPVWAGYSGDGTYSPSQSSPIYVTVNPEPSTTTLNVQGSSLFGQPLTSPFPFGSVVFVRADVAGQSGFGNPTGCVNFTDTFGPLPAVNPQSNPPVAVASCPPINSQGNTSIGDGIISFDAGNHTISGSYAGDVSFTSSSSPTPVSFTIQPGFQMVSGLLPVVITAPGGSGSTSVGIVSSSNFTSTITFTCSGLPAEATCAPASATGQGPTTIVSATINVTTTAAHTVARRSTEQRFLYAALLGTLPFAGVFLTIAPRRRRVGALILFMLLTILLLAPACGGSNGGGSGSQTHQDAGTPAGTSTVTVTASSGGITQTGTFTLVIQ